LLLCASQHSERRLPAQCDTATTDMSPMNGRLLYDRHGGWRRTGTGSCDRCQEAGRRGNPENGDVAGGLVADEEKLSGGVGDDERGGGACRVGWSRRSRDGGGHACSAIDRERVDVISALISD